MQNKSWKNYPSKKTKLEGPVECGDLIIHFIFSPGQTISRWAVNATILTDLLKFLTLSQQVYHPARAVLRCSPEQLRETPENITSGLFTNQMPKRIQTNITETLAFILILFFIYSLSTHCVPVTLLGPIIIHPWRRKECPLLVWSLWPGGGGCRVWTNTNQQVDKHCRKNTHPCFYFFSVSNFCLLKS